MAVPAIPPELVEQIFKQLPVGDAQTISTLVACTLVSRTFHTIAKHDSIWKPIADLRWRKGRTPTFVQLADQEDQAQMELAFPTLQQRESPSVYQAIVARPQIKRIIDRHLAALLAEPANKIPHLLAIVELGEQNAMPFLSELACMSTDKRFPDDWLARRYWARQARGAISRRRAVDVWKRIGEGWDDAEAFYEGIFAFSAFHGSQDRGLVDLYLPPSAEMLKKGAEYLGTSSPGRPHDMDALREVAALLKHTLSLALRVDLDAEPNDLPATTVSDFFVLNTLDRIAEAHKSGDDERRVPSQMVVLAALMCAIAAKVSGILPLNVQPVIIMDALCLEIAWRTTAADATASDTEEFYVVGFVQPELLDAVMLKEVFRHLPAEYRAVQQLGFAAFCAPTSTRVLLQGFLEELAHANDVQQRALGHDHITTLSQQDVASYHYAWALCPFLIHPSSSVSNQLSPMAAMATPMLSICLDLRFNCDAELLRERVLPRLQADTSSEWGERLAVTIEEITVWDGQQKPVERRSETDSTTPRFKVGEVVTWSESVGEFEMGVIVGWEMFLLGTDEEWSSGHSTFKYEVLAITGISHTVTETDYLQPHRPTKEELKAFLKIADLGQHFKRADHGEKDGRAPSFVLAEDVRKLYPDG